MEYPKHIYRKFKIVEKDILGVKHYAAMKLFCIFGYYFPYKYMTISWCETYFEHSPSFGTVWVTTKSAVERCIDKAKTSDEQDYYWRLRK